MRIRSGPATVSVPAQARSIPQVKSRKHRGTTGADPKEVIHAARAH